MTQMTPYLTTEAAYALANKFDHKVANAGWQDNMPLYIQKVELRSGGYDYTLVVLEDNHKVSALDWIVLGEDDLRCKGAELAETLIERLGLLPQSKVSSCDIIRRGIHTSRFTVAQLRPLLPTLANRRRYKLSLLIN